jgi:hypothetical protein
MRKSLRVHFTAGAFNMSGRLPETPEIAKHQNACANPCTWPGVYADMTTKTKSAGYVPDPAAVFASALSLWQASQNRASKEQLNLSECYNGMDQFLREIMRIANQFEAWACLHIGVGGNGLIEHIADRETYSEALSLARKLAPGVAFPRALSFSPKSE